MHVFRPTTSDSHSFRFRVFRELLLLCETLKQPITDIIVIYIPYTKNLALRLVKSKSRDER